MSKKRHAKRKEKARALAKSLGERAQAHTAAKHAARMAKLAEKKAKGPVPEDVLDLLVDEIAAQEPEESPLTAALNRRVLEGLRAVEGHEARVKFLDPDFGPDASDDSLPETDPEDILELLVDEIAAQEPEESPLTAVLYDTELPWHEIVDAVRNSPYAHYVELMLPAVEACGYPLTVEEHAQAIALQVP